VRPKKLAEIHPAPEPSFQNFMKIDQNPSILVSQRARFPEMVTRVIHSGTWIGTISNTNCDHLPLYRHSEIYERAGVEPERLTLADWVGGSSQLLDPLVEALRRYMLAEEQEYNDDS
jgi:transposase